MCFHGPWAQHVPLDFRLLEASATAGDELVLGTDGWQVVLFSAPPLAPLDWTKGQTRIAHLASGPWQTKSPRKLGLVPIRDEAWSVLGHVVHVDIDLPSNIAVISSIKQGRFSVWISAKRPDNAWTKPWQVPILEDWPGQAAFGMFDVQPDREGDILVALRPDEPADTAQHFHGAWSGGFDIVRIPRRGNYQEAHILTELNTPQNEWALTPHPISGGWLASDGRGGEGGVDPWWVSTLPFGLVAHEKPEETLVGHGLVVQCGDEPLSGVRWTLEDAQTGMPVSELVSDVNGRVALDGLRADRGTRWVATPPISKGCNQAMAVWINADGQVVQRFSLIGEVWRLNLLAALALDAWQVQANDQSRLPELSPLVQPNHPADWVVFHSVGSPLVPAQGVADLKSWAVKCKENADCHVLVMGQASPDGNAEDNVQLAKERARQVAVQLEFAGVSPRRIRVEGHGFNRPMVQCPNGMTCPEGVQERSRRTELYLIPSRHP